jgi:hypothetical protein
LFSDLDSQVSLAFLERYPSPPDARGLGEQRLRAFLDRQGYRGRKTPAALLTKLREAPEGRAGEIETQARRAIVLGLIAAIKQLVAQIKALEGQIRHAIHSHPDGEIFLSLFRSPTTVLTAATLLSEIGDCRARYPTADALSGDAGQAAVAIESGKRKVASYRWACNKRLRDAVDTLCDTTRQWHPWAEDRYAAARARGHDHPRATRTLGRAWCRVIWRCWQDRVPYDPERHGGLQRHALVTVPTPSGPRPDLAATQRMLGAAVTQRTACKAEREALDGTPTTAKPTMT